MKASSPKCYKRKLSQYSLDRMSLGGRKGSIEDKRRAGKAGWQALLTAKLAAKLAQLSK